MLIVSVDVGENVPTAILLIDGVGLVTERGSATVYPDLVLQ